MEFNPFLDDEDEPFADDPFAESEATLERWRADLRWLNATLYSICIKGANLHRQIAAVKAGIN